MDILWLWCNHSNVMQLLLRACSGVHRKFSRGVSFSDIWWPFAFSVRCFGRHNLTSYSCFQTHVLAKFVDTLCIFFYTHSPYFVCHCTEYKLSALQRSKTHTSLRQSKLQQQNQAALMSRQIRAVERMCAAGLVGVHPGLQDRILLNYTRTENAHKVRKKTFVFLLCIEVQQTFSFRFSLLKHYQIPECFYVNNCCFELMQLFYHATEIGNVSMPSAHALSSR